MNDGDSTSDRKRKSNDASVETPAPKRFVENKPSEVSPEEAQQKRPSQSHTWEVDETVRVKLRDKSWVVGRVTAIIDGPVTYDEKSYDYAIEVQYQDAEGLWVKPSTWHENPYAIPKGVTKTHIRKYNELVEGLPETQKDQYKAIKAMKTPKRKRKSKTESDDEMDANIKKENDDDTENDDGMDIDEAESVLDTILLGNCIGDDGGMSLRGILASLKRMPEVKQIISLATGKDTPELSVLHLLAYMLGTLSGCEFQRLSSSRDESTSFTCSPTYSHVLCTYLTRLLVHF
jgi:hypothetical protein